MKDERLFVKEKMKTKSVPNRQFQVRKGKKRPGMSLRELCKVNAVFPLQGCRPRPKTDWEAGRRNIGLEQILPSWPSEETKPAYRLRIEMSVF